MRFILLASLAAALVLAGCSEESPVTAPGKDQTIFFTSFDTGTLNPIGTIQSITTDGSYRTTITRGTLLGPPRNGRMIFITDEPAGSFSIYVSDVDGSNRTTFLQASSFLLIDRLPLALTPQADRLFFMTGGNPDTLKVGQIDGTGAVTLGTFDNRFIALSPDGSRVAFYRETIRSEAGNIITIGIDGSDQRVSALGVRMGDPMRIDWSPDGSRLLFAAAGDSNRSYLADIFVVNADGSGLNNLTSDTLDQISAAWSPDGSKITFTQGAVSHGVELATYDLWTMNADGTGRTLLVGGTTAAEFQPEWSPHGNRILFIEGMKSIIADDFITQITVEGGAGPLRVASYPSGHVTTLEGGRGVGWWLK